MSVFSFDLAQTLTGVPAATPKAKAARGAALPAEAGFAAGFVTDAGSDAMFYPTHGVLAPAAADAADYASLTTRNPLNALTYAIFKVRMKTTALDPNFNFR